MLTILYSARFLVQNTLQVQSRKHVVNYEVNISGFLSLSDDKMASIVAGDHDSGGGGPPTRTEPLITVPVIWDSKLKASKSSY